MTSMQTQRKERPNQATPQEMIRQLGHKNETVTESQTSDTPAKPRLGMLYSHLIDFNS